MTEIIETLNWIHSHKASGRRPSLKRMHFLLSLLDNPQDKLSAIHVVGTNGKGSTTSFLQHILTFSGYKTGTFTSPFITCFNERIAVDGVGISDKHLITTVHLIKPIVDSDYFKKKVGQITEFELITALMFYYFVNIATVDIAVIEAGVGGAFDATNVFKAQAIICPSISLDHQETLGNSLTDIAKHKAGVLKSDSPFIFGKMSEDVCRIFYQKAKQVTAPTYELGKEFFFEDISNGFHFHYHKLIISNIYLKMLGKHQKSNASLAAMTSLILQKQFRKISPSTIKMGLEETSWPGRCELITSNLMLDGAHNEDSITKLVDVLENNFPKRTIHVLFAGLNRKPLAKMLKKLAKYDVSVTTFDYYQAQELSAYPPQYHKVADYRNWISKIEKKPSNDLFVVTGSLYFISEVRNTLFNK